MKSIIVTYVLFLALASVSSTAETFISSGETNSILVGTNEAIIVDFVINELPTYRKTGFSSRVQISKGSAFAGPCEILYNDPQYTGTEALVTFHRVQTLAMSTLVLGDGETNTVVVPSGKTLKLFAAGIGQARVSQGTNSANTGYGLASGCELTGPLTVQFIGKSGVPALERQVFSYYLVEDFIEITADGYLKGPTGTFEVLVEKSTDLAQWQPVMVQNTASADVRAFYRLRIQK